MGEMMDLFEALENQTYRTIDLVFDIPSECPDVLVKATIRAYTEALKEMMVLPVPFKATLQHHITVGGLVCTTFHTFYQDVFDGHHGTDGEEVYGLVFRVGKELLVPEEPPLDEEDR